MSAAPHTLRTLVRSRPFALLAGIVLTTAIACRDVLSPKQPPATAPTLKPSGAPQHDESPNNSPDLKSFDLTMTDATDGTMGTSAPNVLYPFATVLRVTVKGLENRLPLFSQIGDPITRGPSGHAVFGWVDGGVYSQVIMGPSTNVSAESVVVYQQLKGTLTNLGRSGYGTRRYDGTWFNGVQIWCGQDHDHPCDNWTGTTNFNFVRLDAGLTLTVDSAIANSGSVVKFKLRSVPDSVEGQQIPVIVDTASWVPDPDSLGGDYTELQKSGACNFSGYPKTCQRTLEGPGTLNVIAYSNGKRFALSQHVTTRDARPLVTPSKFYARHAGDTVNFTVRMSDGSNFTMWNWIWFADTTPSHTQKPCASYANPCLNTRVFEAGYMQATVSHGGRLKKTAVHIKVGVPPRLQLSVNPNRLRPNAEASFSTSAGDAPYSISSWTYKLTNGSIGTTGCTAPNKTCASAIPGTGTMMVTGTVDGSPDSASAPVTIYTKFTLDADKTTTIPGAVVTFTPKLDDAPTSAARFRWQVDTGSSDTVACAGGDHCQKTMTRSGTMWAYLSTLGGDSASAHVTVIDTVGTGCLSITSLTRPSRPARWAVTMQLVGGTCAPTLGSDTSMLVACTMPNGTTRGSLVHCEATVQPATLPFKMRLQTATRFHANDMSPYPPYEMREWPDVIEVPQSQQYAANGRHVWEGPLASRTIITMFADITRADGSVVTLAATDSAVPTRRNWSRWSWDNINAKRHDDSVRIATPTYTQPPQKDFQIPPPSTALLGMMVPQVPMLDSAGGTRVQAGPDSGVVYAVKELADQEYEIFIHPAIRRPLTLSPSHPSYNTLLSWQQRQTGGSAGGGKVYCDTLGIDSLYRFAKRHEGWTQATNSHWGIGDSVFAAYPIHEKYEALTFPTSADTAYDLRNFRFQFYYGNPAKDLRGPLTDPNKVFDAPSGVEYTGISNICVIRP